MKIVVSGRIGHILLLVLALVAGIGLLAGFSLPSAVVGIWLVIGALLALVGI